MNGGYKPGDYKHPVTPEQQLEVMVGAILAQNTAWANAQKAVENLVESGLLDPAAIRAASQERLAEVIRPSGYYNQKALKLQAFAEFLAITPISRLQELEIPELRAQLLAIKGVGPETADSMILYALHKPIFVVDAYTRRILTRMGFVAPEDATYDHAQAFFHQSLAPDQAYFNEYHALLVRHAVETCKKKPRCENCLLGENCKKMILPPKKKRKTMKKRPK